MFRAIFRFFGKLIKRVLKFAWWLIKGFLTPWGLIIRLVFIGAVVGLVLWIVL